jgi:hypothetical protein
MKAGMAAGTVEYSRLEVVEDQMARTAPKKDKALTRPR